MQRQSPYIVFGLNACEANELQVNVTLFKLITPSLVTITKKNTPDPPTRAPTDVHDFTLKWITKINKTAAMI